MNFKKRILQVNVDDLGYGGVFSLVMNLLQHMPDDIIFDFCSIEEFQHEENIRRITERGGKYYCIGYQGNKIIRQFKNFYNIYKFFKAHDYEIVHIHSDLSFKIFNYGLAAKLAGVKFKIFHSHSTGIDNGNRLIKRIAHEIFKKFLPFLADDYFACSKNAAEWMFGKKKDNTHILFNAIDLEKFRYNEKVRSEIRHNLNIEDKFVIGHVGRFAFQKNHEFLLDIFDSVLKIKNNALLLLIGEGELENKVRDKAHKLGLDKNIIFYGVSKEIYNMMQAMDVFVFPSRFEGLGIAAIEAQASGLPTICSETIPEEANATDLFVSLNLNDSTDNWAEKITSFKTNRNRDIINQMRKYGYDIIDVSEKLYDYYCSLG